MLYSTTTILSSILALAISLEDGRVHPLFVVAPLSLIFLRGQRQNAYYPSKTLTNLIDQTCEIHSSPFLRYLDQGGCLLLEKLVYRLYYIIYIRGQECRAIIYIRKSYNTNLGDPSTPCKANYISLFSCQSTISIVYII